MSHTFASDNFAGVHPEVFAAMQKANVGHAMAYARIHGQSNRARCLRRFLAHPLRALSFLMERLQMSALLRCFSLFGRRLFVHSLLTYGPTNAALRKQILDVPFCL